MWDIKQATECPYQQDTKKCLVYRFVPLEMGGNGGLISPPLDLLVWLTKFLWKNFKKWLSSHAAAWYIPKIPKRDVGRHFNLDECHVWVDASTILELWESGLVESNPSFAEYYIRFIGHFVRVYEVTAPICLLEKASTGPQTHPTPSYTWIMDAR